MENYINNIVADMREYIKAKPETTPDAAWHHAMDMVESVGTQRHLQDIEEFVRTALKDPELRKEAHDIDAATYRRSILYDTWLELDTLLYMLVCLIKHDEIIRRFKESSTTRRRLN